MKAAQALSAPVSQTRCYDPGDVDVWVGLAAKGDPIHYEFCPSPPFCQGTMYTLSGKLRIFSDAATTHKT